eukprot:3060454-Pyramimonas_sp.AAC.1
MQQWLINARTYSTQCSQVVQLLESIQKNASKQELGHDADEERVEKSVYRHRLDARALKALSEGTRSSVVTATLPSFTYNGITVGD